MDFKSRPRHIKYIDGVYTGSPSRHMDLRKQTARRPGPSPMRPTIAPMRPAIERPTAPLQSHLTNNERPLIGSTLPNGGLGRHVAEEESRRRGLRFWKRRKAHEKHKKWTRKRKFITASLSILLVLVSVLGVLGFDILGNVNKVFHGNIVSDASALFSTTKLNGEAQGRVNILLLGDSSDRTDASANGGDLTDSIMVLSIDTKNNTAFMLSIPRDLWVNIPGVGYSKINATYENDGFSGLEQLVQTDFGIPINYYALVNYGAFEGLVDDVGGVTVNIQSPDPRGLYDPQPFPGATALKLPNGPVTLNGVEALNLARARGDAYGSYGFPQSDFDRTQHQRQLLVAIAQKAQTAGIITNPLKISQIFSTLSANVKTDLTLQDALRLAQLAKATNLTTNVQSEAYSYGGSNSLLTSYTAPDGESALIPTAGLGDYSQMQAFYNQLTSSNPIVKEGATVFILNGSDVVGLAKQEEGILTNEGFNVEGIADASQEYPDSMIVDMSNGQDPAAKQALQKVFSSNTTTTTSTTTPVEATEAQNYTSNFVVVLGKNWDGTQVQSSN